MPLEREEIRILCQINSDVIIAFIEQQEATIKQQGATIEQQEATIEQQEATIEQQGATIEQQETTIKQREATIEQQEATITHLEVQITELEAQRKQTSRNSNKPPSSDGFKKVKNQRKKGERAPGGQKGHKGKTLEMVDNPDHVEVHTVNTCEKCRTSLKDVKPSKVHKRQVHDVPPLTIVVTEYQAEQKACPNCGHDNHGDFPPEVKYPLQYGVNLKALMVYLCIYQLLPYNRACETFLDLFGRRISKATLVKAVAECFENLAGVEARIRELLVESQVIHVDETGMRVSGIRHWLHVVSTKLFTWYGHHRKRGSEAMDAMQILPRFKGTLVHDCWAPYFHYPSRHAICNAHILRELTGISDNYGQKWSTMMHDLLDEIYKTVEEAKLHVTALNPQQILEFVERYRIIVHLGLEENPAESPLSDCIPKRGRKKQSKAKNLLDRCQKFEKEILSFMYDFTIPFSNNQAERDIRMVKLQQKISGTFRSDEGAHWFCRVRGYLSTVKKNDVPVLTSLVNAFKGNPFVPSCSNGQAE